MQSLQSVKNKWLPEFVKAMQKEKENKKDDKNEWKERIVGVLCGTKADQLFKGGDLDHLSSESFLDSQKKVDDAAESLV